MKIAAYSFILLFFLAGCQKQQIISDVPHIEYKGYERIKYPNSNSDSLIILTVFFEDGDGDIGLDISDTVPPFRLPNRYFYNLFVDYEEYRSGAYMFILNGSDTVNYNDRVTKLEPTSRYKSINGEMHIHITPLIYAPFSQLPDSFRCTIKIVDRKLHESNSVQTPGINFN